jgi:ADP-ribose pyrophosphatase YjhB (NUDIX family)
VTDRQRCAGAIVHDGSRRLLMIRRGQAPAAGSWSLPGGRCHPGEGAADACVREVAEETGLVVAVTGFAGRVERAAPGGGVYVIDDFLGRVVGGTLRAGDDASDAQWVTRAEMHALDLAPGVFEALTDWAALPD